MATFHINNGIVLVGAYETGLAAASIISSSVKASTGWASSLASVSFAAASAVRPFF